MKTNAILRIIIWSLVLVLLLSILSAGLLYRNVRRSSESPAETAVPMPLSPSITEDGSAGAKGIVTATAVNVRSSPSSSSSTVGYVEKGDEVTIGGGETVDGKEWIWISSPVTGWLVAEYVNPVEDVVFHSSDPGEGFTKTVTAADILPVYATPEESTTRESLEAGTVVTIGRQETINGMNWTYILEPTTGWVPTDLLQSAESSVANSASTDISLDARQIQEIDIEWAAGNITIQPAEVDAIQISESTPSEPKYAMVWKQSGDKLTIQFCESIKLDFNFGITINDVISKDLMILVPMGWECDSLDIEAASATVDVKDLVIREVDFDGASGTCNFVNCVVDQLDLDTASGDVYYTGSLNILDCDAASASVYAVFDNVPSRIDMDSMSGDLDITLPSNAGFTVSMDGLSTDFVSDFGYSQNRDGSYHRGNGQCKISMDAMSGDIYLREYKEAAAAAIPDPTAVHHHTDACTTDPDSCPEKSAHHTEPHHP